MPPPSDSALEEYSHRSARVILLQVESVAKEAARGASTPTDTALRPIALGASGGPAADDPLFSSPAAGTSLRDLWASVDDGHDEGMPPFRSAAAHQFFGLFDEPPTGGSGGTAVPTPLGTLPQLPDHPPDNNGGANASGAPAAAAAYFMPNPPHPDDICAEDFAMHLIR